MAKNNTKANVQPQPQMGGDEAAPIVETSMIVAEPVKVEQATAGFFSSIARDISKRAADKADAVNAAKQKLAMAADFYDEGASKAGEADIAASEAAILLYKARMTVLPDGKPLLSATEMSAVLGDAFGYKMKGGEGKVPAGHPKASKTPYGQGESVRKRLVRAVDAGLYVLSDGKEASKFFEGLPVEEIAAISINVGNGSTSIFTAYKSFADVKAEHTEKRNAAFSAKAVRNMVDAYCAADALSRIKADEELSKALADLRTILNVFDAEG